MQVYAPKVTTVVWLTLAISLAPVVAYATPKEETEAVLQSAESFFKAMKQRKYLVVWKLLSNKSRTAIVEDTAKRAAGVYSKEQIDADFSVSGLIAKSYWDEYLFQFDPDTVLEQSKWEMGPITRQQAEIILQYRKAEQAARLKMFREENLWKVGLIETFGMERRDKPLW